jgi:hypothetical protein
MIGTQTNATISAWDTCPGIHINLYGRSGTGKTTLWSTFPGPILALICSGGNKPGELKSIDTPENRKKITPLNIKSSKEFGERVRKAFTENWQTIVLDHATGLQDLILAEILGIEEAPPQLSWGLATQQQYGQLALQMKEHLRTLLNFPLNVVVVAQERDFNTEGTNELIMPYIASALTPSVVGWLNPACDYVVNTFIRQKEILTTQTMGEGKNKKETTTRKVLKGQVEYCLRTGPDAVFTTKFRIPKGRRLPEVIVDPSYQSIIKLIKGE